jgi:tetratricopeptide (TPR) repeat protein
MRLLGKARLFGRWRMSAVDGTLQDRGRATPQGQARYRHVLEAMFVSGTLPRCRLTPAVSLGYIRPMGMRGRSAFPGIKWFACLLAWVALASGCSRSVAVQDAQEESSPLMRRARARADEGDVDAAIRLYKAVLENNERLARAHLDLALLLNDHKKDYVRAIYHYQRYIELRPDAEKTEMIEDRIRIAGQQFAARINRPDKREADRAVLEKENAELKDMLKSLKAEVARLQPQTADSEPVQQAKPTLPPVAAVVAPPVKIAPRPTAAAVSVASKPPVAGRIRT